MMSESYLVYDRPPALILGSLSAHPSVHCYHVCITQLQLHLRIAAICRLACATALQTAMLKQNIGLPNNCDAQNP